MLKKFEIQGVHTDISDELRQQINKKIGNLDRYLSRHSRLSAHAEVFLKGSNSKDQKDFTCEVTMYLPHQTIVATETATNMFTAVDSVELKLKQQLHEYKERHESGKTRRHALSRLGKRSN